VTAFVTAGAGFLLAVLWFDLMFDVQVLAHRGELPREVLESISGYYRRVTTSARPMNRLVGAVMLAAVASICLQLARGDAPAWVGGASLVLAVSPIALAAVHTLPAAVRLGDAARAAAVPGAGAAAGAGAVPGAGGDGRESASRTARAICRDHLFCLAAVASLIVVQLGFGR